MSQENVFSQSSNSQNDIGQQTLEEIKTRSERIIKQKIKDDFKLNNLQKDHQDFQKLIDEKNQQISDAEKDNHYLVNAIEQLEITRNSVKTDVEMIVKSVAEYFDLFNDLKTSVENIKSEFNQNEDVIEDFSKKVLQFSSNSKFQDKVQELNYKQKLLKDLLQSNATLKSEKTKCLENRKLKILHLDKEEQELLVELKVLQNKDDELKKEFDLKNILKDDLQNDLKIKQEKYDAVLQKFETEKLNTDKQIEEMESTYNSQREKINDLEKKLEELSADRRTQNSSTEEAQNEIKNLEKYLSELENIVKKQEDEECKYKKLIEELRLKSSTIIDEDEKLLGNLDEELCKIYSSNDQIQSNIINDKKILDDLKNEEDLKKEEINSLQKNLEDLTTTIQENETKYTEIINGYNIEINEIRVHKQNLLERKEKLIMEKDNISQMISDLQLKKSNRINESAQIESKQKVFINEINEEITNLRNILVILEEDCENIKNSYDIQFEEISLKFKERKNEILESTNQYKERMEIIERKAEESFKIEKAKYLDDQTKMELQISEFNAAIDNLQGELKKIVKQINTDNNTTEKPEKAIRKSQNILKQNGPVPEYKNNKEEIVAEDKVFEWTTDEEEYNLQKSQKFKTETSESKLHNIKKKLELSQKKKENSKPIIKKMLINKISSTDSDLDWIQPASKAFRKSK